MDITEKSGGKLHMAISICNYLKKIKNYNFRFITTFQSSKKILDEKLNLDTILYDKNKFYKRLFNKLKKKFHFLPYKFPFEKFLAKEKIDLVFFLDPSPLIRSFENIKNIYTIFDIEHRELKNLPEFYEKNNHSRDYDYNLAGKKSNKIIVGTKNLKKKISEIYKIESSKILDLKFPPPITEIKNINISKIEKNIYQAVKGIDYLFYPAQFWKHKNHVYIIEAVYELQKVNKLDFKIIFTGYDKGNLKNIKNLIHEKNLKDKFIIFDYVKDEELYYLYENCMGVVIPTLVAPHTFPLYEAFYFKKPIIYNSSVIDPELKDKVIGLDVKNTNHLQEIMIKLKNKEFTKDLIKKNYDYFKKTFNENSMVEQLSRILKI